MKLIFKHFWIGQFWFGTGDNTGMIMVRISHGGKFRAVFNALNLKEDMLNIFSNINDIIILYPFIIRLLPDFSFERKGL